MNKKRELREVLRDKFVGILTGHVPEGVDEMLSGLLLDAVDEIYAAPVIISISPSEEQLERLREAIKNDTATLIYGQYAKQDTL